jgi:hypothetical protein
MALDSIKAADRDAPTTELRAGAVGDRCTNCDSPLASDQRYCVNCGDRRGKSRYSFGSLAEQTPARAQAEERPPAHRSRTSAGATLVAGVGTLLLAMGVGVLIGHNNSSSPTRASAPVQVVTVGGGGVAAGGASSAGTGSARGSKHRKVTKAKATKVHLSKKTTQAATVAAGKVLGNSGNLAPATVKAGDKCASGAGCQGGKFTGNFFSP